MAKPRPEPSGKTFIQSMSDTALLDAVNERWAALRSALIDADIQRNAIFALERELNIRYQRRGA